METRENIIKELQTIAPKLAAIEKKNFYSVPQNYFLNFKSEMLEQVKLSGVKQELKTLAPNLLKVEKLSAAEVPANYFNSFSGDLIRKIRANKVAAELKEVAPALAAIEGKENLLKVPANYFNAFPQQMITRLGTEQNVTAVAKPGWVDALNNVLENIAKVVFKPQYSFAFAGAATVLIIAVMVFSKVEQPATCTDLLCMAEAKNITNEELDNYLDKNNEAYQEEVFEADFTDKTTGDQVFKDALNDVSDEDLNNAILD